MDKIFKQKKVSFILVLMFIFTLIVGLDSTSSEVKNATNYSVDFNEKISACYGLPNPSELEMFLDSYIPNQLATYNTVGMTISVVRDGQLVLAKGYGYRDLTPLFPVNPNRTLFRIGSVSKTFTAVAVLQLVEDGILDLDTDVNNYLTAFKIPETYSEPITLKHLLTHSAGFEELAGRIFFDIPGIVLPMEGILIDYLPDRVYPPGEITSYSNYGLTLAGYIVEVMSGIPFEDYIENEILIPMGMNHTTFKQPLPASIVNDMSEGYDENRVEGSFEYIYILPAGSCSSTAVDMSKWMIMLLNNGSYNGTEILKPESVTLMQEDHFVAHPYLPAVNLGLYEMDINNIHIIGHGGDTYYFHSTMALFPELNFGFFISYNSHIGLYANSEFLPVFVSTFFPHTSETITPMEEYDKGLNDFTGHYISSRRYYSEKTINFPDNYTRNIEMKDYFDTFSEIITVDGYLRFVGLDIDFIQVEPDYFREATGDYEVSMAFIRDETGKVSYLYTNFIPTVVTFEKLHPIYIESTAIFILLMIVGILYVIALGMWSVQAIIKFKKEKSFKPVTPIISRLWVLGVLTFAVSTASITYSMSYAKLMLDTQTISDFGGLIALPIINIVLIAGMLVFSILSWIGIGNPEKKPYWKLWERIIYSVLTLMSTVFIISFAYWHLLGY